jgi:uncharacterized protein (TIGR02099 family)
LGKALLVLGLACAAIFIILRGWLLPMIGEQREWFAAKLGEASGLPVSIERLAVEWPGLRPQLYLGGLAIHDAAGREALRLERIDATLAWSSLWHWEPRFHRLEIVAPALALGRTADGALNVAGLRLETGGSMAGANGKSGDWVIWLLKQRHILVRDASLTWTDEMRGAPPLELRDVQFVAEGGASRRFKLHARPPAELASALELRGELRRFSVDDLAASVGRIHVELARADLGGWSAWIDYPFPFTGHGGASLWLESDGAGAMQAGADVALERITASLGPDLPPLDISRLGGSFLLRRIPGTTEVVVQNLLMTTTEGAAPATGDFRFLLRQSPDGAVTGGELQAAALDLAVLARLSGSLPLPQAIHEQLAAFEPHGRLRTLALAWEGDAATLRAWRLSSDFEDIGLAAQGKVPGMGRLSGNIEGDRNGGRFRLDSERAHIDLPEVFEQPRLSFAHFKANGSWRQEGDRLELALDSASFANDDAEGTAVGRYWLTASGPGEIDLSARLTRADGRAVWRYLPKVVGQSAHDWVKNAIQRGKVTDTRLQLRGNLADFPFRDGRDEFLVTIEVSDATLDYAPGWPAIEDIEGEVRFAGPGLTIDARHARILDTRLAEVKVVIPDLAQDLMNIDGRANGQGMDFVRFIDESPLGRILDGALSSLRVEGSGQIQLRLAMPLSNPAATEVNGHYRFNDNRIQFSSGPAIEGASGELHFTADSLRIPALDARLLGETVTISAATSTPGRIEFKANGRTSAAAARQMLDWPWLAALDGAAAWQGELIVERGMRSFMLRSALDGLGSRLPAPFTKEAAARWPLSLTGNVVASGALRLEAKLGERMGAVLERDPRGNWRGGIGIEQPLEMADAGVGIAASIDELDFDAWREILNADAIENESGDDGMPSLTKIILEARRLRAFDQTFSDLELRADTDGDKSVFRLSSAQAEGEFTWQRGAGMLVARLGRLRLASKQENAPPAEDVEPAPLRSLPGLDVRVEKFAVGESDLGLLEVRAHNHDGFWQLERFVIRHPDAHFSGSGMWRPGSAPRTRIDFVLTVTNVGQLIRALGYPDAVRGGQATLKGQLDWRGAPIRIDYPTLGGRLELAAANGQFAQLEPGVGRLLGVLSLQALPRRITLDFRDVFSHGFVFDRIAGNVDIANGVMRTARIQIDGPAAKVLMRGEADIKAETQNLTVRVQPTMSESIAIAAAAGLVNPVAGAVTYLGQKVLGDPIEKLFAYEYKITGNWADPVVEKVGAATSSPFPEGN